MFEQSILLDQPTGKKAGAWAASLTVQLAGVGVLILIPLIYNDRLPDIHVWTPLTLPTPAPPAEPPPMDRAQPLRAPTRIPTRVLQLPSPEPRPLTLSSSAWGEPAVGVVAMPHDLPMMGLGLTPQMHLAELAPPPVRPVEVRKIAPDRPIEVGRKGTGSEAAQTHHADLSYARAASENLRDRASHGRNCERRDHPRSARPRRPSVVDLYGRKCRAPVGLQAHLVERSTC
jgi:hypothetical protein